MCFLLNFFQLKLKTKIERRGLVTGADIWCPLMAGCHLFLENFKLSFLKCSEDLVSLSQKLYMQFQELSPGQLPSLPPFYSLLISLSVDFWM